MQALVARLREAEKELEKLRADQVLAAAGGIAAGAVDVGGVAVVVQRVADGVSADDLRKLVLDVRGRLTGVAVVLLSVTNGRPLVVAATDDAARARGLKAGALVGVAARALGGGGGGRDDIAQGGGAKADAADDALAAVLEAVRGALAGG